MSLGPIMSMNVFHCKCVVALKIRALIVTSVSCQTILRLRAYLALLATLRLLTAAAVCALGGSFLRLTTNSAPHALLVHTRCPAIFIANLVQILNHRFVLTALRGRWWFLTQSRVRTAPIQSKSSSTLKTIPTPSAPYARPDTFLRPTGRAASRATLMMTAEVPTTPK